MSDTRGVVTRDIKVNIVDVRHKRCYHAGHKGEHSQCPTHEVLSRGT